MPAMIFSLRVVVDLLRCVMYSTPLRQAFMQAIRDRRFDDAIMHYKQAQDRTLLSERFNGYCPLNSAIKNDNEKFVRFWLEQGGDPNLVDIEEYTALHVIAETGHTKYLPLVLKHGAQMEWAGTVKHYTPLFVAFEEVIRSEGDDKKMQVMRDFVRHGANTEILVHHGNALQTCASATHIEPLMDYWNKNLDYECDILAGRLYAEGVKIDDVIVTGVRKPENRAVNFVVFAARGDFDQIVDYMKKNSITPKPEDFGFLLNKRVPLMEVLQKTGQIDLVADHVFWNNNISQMERFKKVYKDQAPAEFWCKFDAQIEKAIHEIRRQSPRKAPLKRKL